jgi:sulfonate transport system substrate-binding protein
MKTSRRRTLQWLAAAPLLAGTARADQKTVRIGYQKYGLLLVLKARGTLDQALREKGWQVSWSEFPGGIQLVEALNAGRLDFGVVGEGPPIFAQAAGAPLVYLGVEPPAPTAEAIVVAKDSPFKTVADLRGKEIVVNKGSNSHYLLVRALEEAGLAYDGVKVTFVPPAGARAAFEAGKVAAWSIWDPFLASVEAAQGARVLRDGKGLVENPSYYIGTRGFAAAQPALVRTILEEIGRSGAWTNQHTTEVVDLLAPQLGIDRGALKSALTRTRFGVRPIDDKVLAAQQKVADAFARLKLIPGPIQVADARFDPLATAGAR